MHKIFKKNINAPHQFLRYHVEIPTKRQLYISSNWLVEVVWSRQLFIKYNSTLLISETVQIFNNNFGKWKTRRLLLFNLYWKTFFWQYNSLLALLWGECPIIYTQRLMRLDLQYSHIFTVFMIDSRIDFDKCYRYPLICIDMIPTLWSIMSQILLDYWIELCLIINAMEFWFRAPPRGEVTIILCDVIIRYLSC